MAGFESRNVIAFSQNGGEFGDKFGPEFGGCPVFLIGLFWWRVGTSLPGVVFEAGAIRKKTGGDGLKGIYSAAWWRIQP